MGKDPVVVRTYRAPDLARATKAYERDARVLAMDGYIAIMQIWEAAKPKGSLTLTYSLHPQPRSARSTRRSPRARAPTAKPEG